MNLEIISKIILTTGYGFPDPEETSIETYDVLPYLGVFLILLSILVMLSTSIVKKKFNK